MKKKNRKLKRSGLAGVLDTYNNKETGAGNAGNTALKTVVDSVIGVPIGIALGGASGLWSLPFGLVLIGAGHHFKDQSALLRIIGASAIAYGVAKNIEFNNQAKAKQLNTEGAGLSGTVEGVKERLITVKEDLMSAFFLDKIFKKDEPTTPTLPTSTTASRMEELTQDESEISGFDLSELDVYDSMNEQEADEFANEQQFIETNSLTDWNQQNQIYPDPETISEETSFNLFDDEEQEPDLTGI